MKRYLSRIRPILYGDQRLFPWELELLHTRVFQRLYDLHQLGFTDRVFVDASHSRFHHVVGVLEQVDKLVEAIRRDLLRVPSKQFEYGLGENTGEVPGLDLSQHVGRMRPVARLIGLLHDMTHSPYGHTLEDEIRLFGSRHDDPERQAEAFFALVSDLVLWLAIEAGGRQEHPKLTSELLAYLDSPEIVRPPEESLVVEVLARVSYL